MNAFVAKAKPYAGLVAVSALALIVYGWIAVNATIVGGFSDSIDYLVFADFYAGFFSGDPGFTAVTYYRVTRFPPVFPLLIAAVGGGTEHLQAAMTVTVATAIAAVAMTWVWVRRATASAMVATVIALALVLYPEFFLWVLYPTSEALTLALMALVFWLALTPAPTRTRVLATAALIGLIPLVRMIGVALVAAFAVWLLRVHHLRWRDRAVAVAVAAVPAVAWLLYRSTLAGAESYVDSFAGERAVPFSGGWMHHLLSQPLTVIEAVAGNWWPGNTAPWLLVIAGLFVLLAAIGWGLRVRDNALDAWFFAAYMGIVLVWPYPAEAGRFLAAIAPVPWLAAACGLSWLRARLLAGRQRSSPTALTPQDTARPHAWTTAALVAVIFAISLPTVLQFGRRALAPAPDDLAPFKITRSYFTVDADDWAEKLLEVGARIHGTIVALPQEVKPGQCVYAVSPAMVFLYGKVQVYAYRYDLTADNADELLSQCDYFLVMSISSPQRHQPYLFPLREIDPFARPLLANYFEFRGAKSLAAALLVREKPLHASAGTQQPK